MADDADNSELRIKNSKLPLDGIFNIAKPSGLTSFDVVARVRRIAGQKRVGHAGTLDPLATGVLPVVLGKATRLVEYLADADKAYRAVVTLGAASDTYDAEGTITPTLGVVMPDREQVEATLGSFRGAIEQLPPMYSAIKVGGKKLYELARAGIEVERRPRHVVITRLDLEAYTPPTLQIFVECSKGTYIRSLAHDLGTVLGTGAYLSSLVRTRHGPFTLEGAITLEALEAAFRDNTWQQSLYPPEYILRNWRTHTATPEEELRIRQGKLLLVPAPGEGERDMLAATTGSGELLAVLCWDGEKEGWQPKKVFGNAVQEAGKSEPVAQIADVESDMLDTTDELIQILLDKQSPVRNSARWRLTNLKEPAALDALVAIVLDETEDKDFRKWTIIELGEFGRGEVVEPLLKVLNSPDMEISSAAATTLSTLHDERAVEPLIELMLRPANTREERNNRRAAISALGEIGDRRAVAPLLAFMQDKSLHSALRSGAVSSLGRIGDASTIPPITQTLKDTTNPDEVRAAAVQVLGRLGCIDEADLFLQIAKDQNNALDLRRKAVDALAAVKQPSTYSYFAELAADATQDTKLRFDAIEAIGSVGYAEGLDTLFEVLTTDENFQVPVAEALGQLKDTRATERILLLLRDGGVKRAPLIEALQWMGDRRAVQPLIGLLNDADEGVQKAAATALGELGDESAIEPLRATLFDGERTRYSVLQALCKLHDREQYDLVLSLLKDEDSDARWFAIPCISNLADVQAIEALSQAFLVEEDHDNRADMAWTLKDLAGKDALPVLRQVQEKYRGKWNDYGTDTVNWVIAELEAEHDSL